MSHFSFRVFSSSVTYNSFFLEVKSSLEGIIIVIVNDDPWLWPPLQHNNNTSHHIWVHHNIRHGSLLLKMLEFKTQGKRMWFPKKSYDTCIQGHLEHLLLLNWRELLIIGDHGVHEQEISKSVFELTALMNRWIVWHLPLIWLTLKSLLAAILQLK